MAYRENAKILKAGCLADGVYENGLKQRILLRPLRLDNLYQYILMMVKNVTKTYQYM